MRYLVNTCGREDSVKFPRRSLCTAVRCHLALAFSSTALLAVLFTPSVQAADFSQAQAMYFAGEYDSCIELAREGVEAGIWNEAWPQQLIEALMVTGRYQDAKTVYEQVATKFSNSLPLRVLGAAAYRYCGEADKGQKLLDEIPLLVDRTPWRFSNRENKLELGRYYLLKGEDARLVLELCYDKALKLDPKYVEAHLAIAELALSKADYQEAVRSLERAQQLRPEDPQVQYLLAKAWAPSDSERASESLELALNLNPYHVDSLLLQARNLIDAELYDAAEKTLDTVFEVNATEPNGWALKAAIAHLRGEYREEGEYRKKGLSTWDLNPAVDHLIGTVLSKHYRFAESIKYQRRSLKLDPGYLPAKFQLAQDLLRVGQDDEGWSIVDQVSAADKYNVVAFNLKTLQDRISKFTTLEAPGLVVRMDAREANIYGERVLGLLTEAQSALSAKYEFQLAQPVTVEIFPQQSDFAIRTFGLPGGAGFLGVCFGNLITANSPASQADSPSNWESVLWHEFCHVITLQKTNNRMPRWLSEGISVYEELERDIGWGQSMDPMYKQMILGEDFVPLSELSSAFLRPKSPVHLQFAYFESALAVKYLVEKHGRSLLLKLLEDLGIGVTIEDAFSRRYGDTALLDSDFETYVKDLANGFLPGTSFDREKVPEEASEAELLRLLEDEPGSYLARRQLVTLNIKNGDWDEARHQVELLLGLYPQDANPGGALELSASIARKLKDVAAEQASLEKLVKYSADNVPALQRLVQISMDSEEWDQLFDYSTRLLAVQPLIPAGHEGLVKAAKELGKPEAALGSLRALQEMNPFDPAGLHYESALALFEAAMIEDARIEALLALEYAPRYREAQRLLVQIYDRLHAPPYDLDVKRPLPGRPPSPSR